MRTTIALLLLSLTLSLSAAGTRTNEILAMFSKSKHVHKEKHGVTKSLSIDRHGEPVVRNDYSGRYEVDGLDLSLRLTRNGGEGTDPRGAFTLRDVRLDGALLTATKVYTNGRTGKLEGVFMDLVTTTNGETSRMFGLGVPLEVPYVIDGGIELERVFYEKQ
jgi:hypothetical protein